MKRYVTFYYLLFVLLILGAFASMAQNDYGLMVLGLVSFSFSVLFALQLLRMLSGKGAWNLWGFIELISLALLALIMGLRVFYIHFAFVEWIFETAGVALIFFHARNLMVRYKEIAADNKKLAGMVVAFLTSVIFYITSMIMVPFFPALAEPIGIVAFILLIAFVVTVFFVKQFMVKGEMISGFAYVSGFKDRSVVLASLFLLFSLYMGLTKIGTLPRMYSDEFPQSYVEMVGNAEAGKTKNTNGKYKYQEFRENYDRFVKRNPSK